MEELPDPPPVGDTAAAGAVDLAGDLAALDDAERELEDLDAALRRLEDGTYGRCESCGEPLGGAYLESHPLARRCPEHAG